MHWMAGWLRVSWFASLHQSRPISWGQAKFNAEDKGIWFRGAIVLRLLINHKLTFLYVIQAGKGPQAGFSAQGQHAGLCRERDDGAAAMVCIFCVHLIVALEILCLGAPLCVGLYFTGSWNSLWIKSLTPWAPV